MRSGTKAGTSISRRTLMSGGAALLTVGAGPGAQLLAAASVEPQGAAAAPELKFVPERTAVLVLHMMNEQLHYKAGSTGYGPEFAESNAKWHVIENTNAILTASRQHNIQIIYVRMSYRPGYPELPLDSEGMPDKVRVRKQRLYQEGSWSTQIADELKPQGSDIVVVNQSASAFCYNELDIILRNKNIRYLVMAGVSTKTIVTCTAIEANLKGYYNYVVQDCCNSRGGRAEHDMFIQHVLPAHAIVTDSKQYIAALGKLHA